MENYSDFVVHKSERAVHTDSLVLTVDDLNDKAGLARASR